MRLSEVTIQNFKGITEENFYFKKGFNVIIGDNAVGKTTILEAISVGLGGFLAGVDGVYSKHFTNEEIHRVGEVMGDGAYNLRAITPVSVECCAQFPTKEKKSQEFRWKRQKKSIMASRSTIEPRDISKYATDLTNDADSVLPVLSYHSVCRMWIKRRERSEKIFNDDYSRTVGYIDCLSEEADSKTILNWFKKMEIVSWQNGKKIAEYEAVKRAIAKFMSVMNKTEISLVFYDKRSNELVFKSGELCLPLQYLSAGYQSVIWMVLDIAYRMSVLNPNLLSKTISKTPGIVLIDELDLHLHPKWQWRIVEALRATFPNVQFIATTHSSIILSSCKNENIIALGKNNEVTAGLSVYGLSINDILEGIQESNSMPENIKGLFSQFYKAIENEEYDKAKHIFGDLGRDIGEDSPEMVGARVTLDLETMPLED